MNHKEHKEHEERRSEDEALDALFHQLDVEVQQQSESQPRCPQVRQELGVVDRVELFDRLQLYDDTPADQQVELLTGNEDVLVRDEDVLLSLDQ